MGDFNQLYHKCCELGIVTSQREFSECMLGMRQSYYSSMTSRRRTPTIASLVKFYLRLGDAIAATHEELQSALEQSYARGLENGLSELGKMRQAVWTQIKELAEC